MSAVTETALPTVRRAALVFIFVTVAIDMLAFGVIIPVLPHLIQDMVGGDTATALVWAGLFGVAYNVMQFVASPIQGALSDRFGRRPVILASNFGLGVDFILMALVQTLPLLFIGRVISGATAASLSTANAYIADVTPPEKRAAAFGMLGAAFGIGFVIGPAIGALASTLSPRAPFWLAAGLALGNFVYGWFVLPESLPPDKRSRFDWKRANPLGSLLLLKRYPQVFGLAAVVFLMQLAHVVYPATFVLFADYRYAWNAQTVGFVLAGVGILSALIQVVLLPRINKRIGERRMLLVGLAFGAVGCVLYALAPTGLLFLAAMPITALWGLANPAAQSLMTRTVDPHEQGRLQGAVTSLAAVAGIFGPALFTQTLITGIDGSLGVELPGLAFVVAAALLAAGLVVALKATSKPHVGAA